MACCVPACMSMPPGERAEMAELAVLLDTTCEESVTVVRRMLHTKD